MTDYYKTLLYLYAAIMLILSVLPHRNQLFFKISEYKHIKTLERHLNNTGKGGTGYSGLEKGEKEAYWKN